jgi:hypothetical protein
MTKRNTAVGDTFIFNTSLKLLTVSISTLSFDPGPSSLQSLPHGIGHCELRHRPKSQSKRYNDKRRNFCPSPWFEHMLDSKTP